MIDITPACFYADGAEKWLVTGALPALRNKIAQLEGAELRRDWVYLPMHRSNADALMKLVGKERLRIDARFARHLAQPFNLKGDLPPIPISMTIPWRHQVQAYHFIMERAGALIAAYMGTGKTLVALVVARNMGVKRMLVMCPKKVVDNWPDEIKKHFGPDVYVCAVDMKLTVKERAQQVQRAMNLCGDRPLIVIINHDSVWREPMLSLLTSGTWDLAVVDESHKIADCRTKLAKACYKIRDRSTKRLALSGTPYKQTPIDIYGEALFVAPEVFGRNFVKFRDTYAQFDDYGFKVIGVKDEDAWDRQTAKFMFSVDQSVLDLPDALHVTRYVTLSDKAQKVYDALAQDFTAWIDTTDPDNPRASAANAAVKVLKLQQITSGFVKDTDGTERELDDGKVDSLQEWFEELPSDEPIVVFARFTHDLKIIQDAAHAAGRSCGEVSGARDDLSRWKRGDLNVLALQIQAGGVGIDLTRSRYCGIYSVGYSLVEYEQMLARTHRPGQTRPVTYVHFTARNTVDEDVDAALAMRRDVIGQLMTLNRRHYEATA